MKRTVIADDQAEFRAILRGIIDSSTGFELVGEAEDGTSVLDLVKSLSPDLLISDIDMPDLDGLDLARIVSTTYPSVAVVLISGNDGYGYETAAIEEGAKAFLTKADLSAEALSRVI